MTAQIATIARYTLLEALRNRLMWLLALAAMAGIGLSGFLQELAITESRQVQVALLAAFLRFAAVFLIATFVITSMVRESNDKGLELMLALPMPRAAYLLGKFSGFALLALLPSALFGALVGLYSTPIQAVLWTMSLACELWLVAAFSLLCVFTLGQIMASLSAVMAFYLLARSITALQLISKDAGADSLSQRLMGMGMDAVSLLLPHLDSFTRSEWLVYADGGWAALPGLLLQTGCYLVLLVSAALFDLYRKNV